ncbi:apolipoprotein C-II [Emydura macquarii macquarii]|uniref:apolipoprotein C-II n=1 Tax=Emydura macquarii macquarii TaxID=1129001 RepID=UPI00352B8B50
MGRMELLTVAACLGLLLLCAEAASYRLQKREAQDSFSQVQEVAKSYWERLNSAAQGWLDSIKSVGVEKKIKDIYEKTMLAAGTYMGVASDQFYHWWRGEQ